MNILIKNGYVLDPANGVSEKRDVCISEGRICAGSDAFRPELTVDASGLAVCPGFIDIHMHEDPVENGRIYDDPVKSGGSRLLRMGVTTGIGGNCG